MFIHVNSHKFSDLTSKTLPSGKRFYTTPDGNVYPSVTTVLGQKEKPYLTEWRHLLGDKKAAQETARCAARGTKIHSLVEQYLNNADETFLRGVEPQYTKGFNQLKVKLKKINNIRAQEVALYSDTLRVAGRVDCVAEYDGVLSIIDFKTSNNNKDKSMIEDYFLQCTAYALMWYEMTQVPIESIVVLMTVERGLVPLTFIERIDKYVKPLLQRIDEFHKANTK